MPDPDFNALRTALLRRGIAPRHATRVSEEMRDHFEDLVEEFEACGMDDTRSLAAESLGSQDDIVAATVAHPELRSWAFRYPRAALVFYPLACAAALPAAPVIAGIQNAPLLARWGASLLAAGVFTTALLLLLQLSILFG